MQILRRDSFKESTTNAVFRGRVKSMQGENKQYDPVKTCIVAEIDSELLFVTMNTASAENIADLFGINSAQCKFTKAEYKYIGDAISVKMPDGSTFWTVI